MSNIQNIKLQSVPPQTIVQPMQIVKPAQTIVHQQQPIQQTITTAPITRSSYTKNVVSVPHIEQAHEQNNTTQISHTYTVSKTVNEVDNGQKSKIEFDLDKIDEQLQMSRKMFPS